MGRYVIFTGGETQKKSALGVSEASLMKNYVLENFNGLKIQCFIEEKSYTTFDNILFSSKMIFGYEMLCEDEELTEPCQIKNEVIIVNGYGCHKTTEWVMYMDQVCLYLSKCPIRPGVTIFCETSRSLKVLLLAWWFLPMCQVKLETIHWEKGSPVKELIHTIYDLASCFFRPLAVYAHNKRFKRSYTI